jgi:uncharacterized Ntn-hydrolase superfamily protein
MFFLIVLFPIFTAHLHAQYPSFNRINSNERLDTTDKAVNFLPVLRIRTMSIIAYDSVTKQLGVAVESHYFSAGPIVPWAESGVGAVATQANADPIYGLMGLNLMRAGKDAKSTLNALMAADSFIQTRQIAMIDSKGNAAAFTGNKTSSPAGHYMGKNYSVQANTMLNEDVWPAMAKAFEAAKGELVDRLVAALDAGQKAGGDIRGKQTAALIVVSGTPTGLVWKDRLFDLRVDDSPEPIIELKRLVRLQKAYRLIGIGDDLAGQKKIELAIKSYKDGVALAPEKEELRYGLALILFLSGKVDEALPVFKQVFAENPIWVEITKRYVASGDLPDDPERIQRILDQAPLKNK